MPETPVTESNLGQLLLQELRELRREFSKLSTEVSHLRSDLAAVRTMDEQSSNMQAGQIQDLRAADTSLADRVTALEKSESLRKGKVIGMSIAGGGGIVGLIEAVKAFLLT